MKLRSKSYLFIGGATLALVVVSTLASIYAFRSYSVTGVRGQGEMASKLVLRTLNQKMMSGHMEDHEVLISSLIKTPGLKDIEVIPSKEVIKQFGQNPADDIHTANELEHQALTTGRMAEKLDETLGEVTYHVAIPYIASSKGDVNCLQCHNVPEGTVLGTVFLSMDMTEQRMSGIKAIVLTAGLIFLFGGFIIATLKRLLNPIIDTTSQLKRVMETAEDGDFSGRLERRSNDEVGDIALHTNQMMSTLEENIGGIFREVETLTGHHENKGGDNLLKRTASIVTNMVAASHFKRAIENDRDLDEVYARLRRTLTNHFSLGRFSLYELNNSKNRLRLVFAEGLPNDCTLWCKPEILVQSDACRAACTARLVSSIEESEICPSFAAEQCKKDADLMHICLPLMLGGSVGGVLQVIFTAKESQEMQYTCAAIHYYLNEAAPVVEAKRLMLSLRESAMHDAMTGLYNRRFLEDYLETLTADITRRKVPVGILMCDVDFFKQVNDTLGHETGDSVLKGVALILKQAVRASDLVIRYGGEEFLGLLIDADEKKTLEIAERVRSAMEENTFQTTSGPLTKTLSVGVSMYPTDNEGFWGCVKFADVALYQAKETGRNQVLRFAKDMWKEDEQV